MSKGEGNLSQRLRITGRHELAQMAQVFNNFTQSIQHLIGQMHHHSSHAVSALFIWKLIQKKRSNMSGKPPIKWRQSLLPASR
ncbi:HAMP domain-containing protein [Chromatium okenii]|uniref:HAMP domain-containing protein n=1 Tax=Chromatium okenii TaxID=61644 RepID=UPI001F5BE856|nr:HAMP domain-containing protein [Chromatium okenii]